MELSKGSRRIFKQQQHVKPKYNSPTNKQKMLFWAGKSNRIENDENEST